MSKQHDTGDKLLKQTLLKEGDYCTNETIDLDNCAKEPIHIPGAVQPHGILLAVSESDLIVVQVSTNIKQYVGIATEDLLNQPVSKILPNSELSRFKKIIQADQDSTMRQTFNLYTEFEGHGVNFDVTLHRSEGLLIIEAEPSSVMDRTSFDYYETTIDFITKIKHAEGLQETSQIAVEEIKKITGYDRVMVYEFDEEWHGAVIAEAKEDNLEPFLGLHYPASDIPKQARELYMRNWLRLIADIGYEPVPITPINNPLTKAPLNLSMSVLRSVSPIHVEYLQNIDVEGTMTISLIHDDELWGLITCHHYSTKYVSRDERNLCNFLGAFFSKELYQNRLIDVYQDELEMKELAHQLEVFFTLNDENLQDKLEKEQAVLLNVVNAQGAAVFYQNELMLFGITPDQDQVMSLSEWLKEQVDEEYVYHTSFLSSVYKQAYDYKEKASGLIFLGLSHHLNNFIIWFRPEKIETVDWAGNPEKAVIQEADGIRLSPRKSFEKFMQVVEAKSNRWTSGELNSVNDLKMIAQKDKEIELMRSREKAEKMISETSATLKESEERYLKLVELSPVAILVIYENNIVFCNKRSLDILNVDKEEEILGKSFFEWLDPDSNEQVMAYVNDMSMDKKQVFSKEGQLLRGDGVIIDIETSISRVTYMKKECVMVIANDISERKKVESDLRELNTVLESYAHVDGLTDIQNRRFFDHTLQREWHEHKVTGKSLSLIMIDIDFFKLYNDQYGHQQGDECLKIVASIDHTASGY